MADEIKEQLDKLGGNVELVVKSNGEMDVQLKAAQVEVKAVKEENLQVKTELTTLREAQVKKDEADKKRDEAIDKMVAERKALIIGSEQPPQTFEEVLFKALQENEDNLTKMINKEQGRKKEWGMELKAVGDMSITNYTGGTRGLTGLRPGIITPPDRKIHVRDIIPTGNIGPGTEYVFMKENGAGEGAIASVAEGAMKPQIDLDLIEASVKIETIAGWLRVTNKAMRNIQGFRSWLMTRLPEKLLRVEDNLILNGDGITPNIKGLQVAGNFTAATGGVPPATIDIEQLVQAISQLEDGNERDATGIVVRPSDYYNILLNKASTSGEYDLPSIVTVDAQGTMRILGIPVVRTTAQTVDKFLVGDFRMGAQFLIQEGIRIEFFEQDSTNVRENKVTIRIEETVAFPVYGSDYFIFGDFANVA